MALSGSNYEFIQESYGNSNGFITRFQKLGEKIKQYHYTAEQLFKLSFAGEKDVYLSQNVFFAPRRSVNTVKSLNMLYIDLDTYNTNYTNEQILMILDEEYFNIKIPRPTYIIDSGRGMYLLWKIDEHHKAINRWKKVQYYFYKQLAEFGADIKALDAARVLRVPGSINSKSGRTVEIIDKYDYTYTLYEIIQEYMPGYSDWLYGDKAKRSAPKKRVKKSKIQYAEDVNIEISRSKDIETLCKLRKGDKNCCRELMLWLYRCMQCRITGDAIAALENTLALNAVLDCPLSEHEVISSTKSANKVLKNRTKYFYKTSKIIKFLGITDEEMQHLNVLRNVTDEERIEKKKASNRKNYLRKLASVGKKTKSESKEQRCVKIAELLSKGKSRDEICKSLNISLSTLKRDIKNLAIEEEEYNDGFKNSASYIESTEYCVLSSTGCICSDGQALPGCSDGQALPGCSDGQALPGCSDGQALPGCSDGQALPGCSDGQKSTDSS